MKPHKHLKVNVSIDTKKKTYSDSANFLVLFLAIGPPKLYVTVPHEFSKSDSICTLC